MQGSAAMLRTTPAECSHAVHGGRAPFSGRSGRQQSSARCQSFQNGGWGNFGMGPTCANMNDPRVREMMQQWEKATQQYSQQGQGWQTPPQANGDMIISIDMVQSEDDWTFYADVPGLQKQDLKIQVNQQERRLTVSGERGEPEVTGPGSELNDRKRYERPHGKFSRSVQLPEDADTSGVSARVDKGVLTVRMHKKRPRFEDVIID